MLQRRWKQVASNSGAMVMTANQRLERAVTRHRVHASSAPFHYALAARCMRQRAVAQPRR